MNKDFYFNFSVSTRPYDRNNDNAAYIKWHETNGNITTLSQYITEGFAYCNCFYHEDGKTFGNGYKKDENVKTANLICLDMDAVKYPYNEFVATMEQTEIKPNIVYTTANNGKFKKPTETYNYRYRVIYVVDEPIMNNALYKEIHQAIKNEIRIITEDDNVFNDNTDSCVSHFFAGCKGATITTDNNIYALSWLMERYCITTDNGQNITRYNNKEQNTTPQSVTRFNNKDVETPPNGVKHTYITDYIHRKLNDLGNITRYNNRERGESIITSSDIFEENEKRFIEDYYNLSFSDLIHKYIRTYPSIECTQIEVDDTQEIITLPSDYTEIRRKWYKESVETDNGQIYNLPNVRKTRNGEGRRNLLFKNLLLRKRITPQISFCHLLLNAVYELHYFIDNTDEKDKITKQQIAQITVNAFFAEDRMRAQKDKRKYKINGLYCAKHGISKKEQAIKFINDKKANEKKNNMEQIKRLYSPNISDIQNLQLLADNDINISMATFRRYKKEIGLSKTYNKRPTIAPKQTDNKDIATAGINAQRAQNTPIIESVEGTNEMPNKDTATMPQEMANKSVLNAPNANVEQIPMTEKINAQRANETANNESMEGTNETANNDDREYNELQQKIQALKTENDIKKFDFNAYYDTLKRHDIMKMVATVNGFNAKEKALSLRETNYVAFMVFVQSKIKSNYDSKENAVLLKMVDLPH